MLRKEVLREEVFRKDVAIRTQPSCDLQQLESYQPHWVREDFIDFIAEKFNPLWSYRKVKARVLSIQQVGEDFYQLQLRPNQNFDYSRYQAGQSILVTVVIAGVRYQRHYSILEINPAGHLSIAIKRQGLVSTALTVLQANRYIEISQPQGDFTLAALSDAQLNLAAKKLLFIASGSGITSIYALLNQALRRTDIMKIDLIYFSRDLAYLNQLMQLSEQYPHFHLCAIDTLDEPQHLDLALLTRVVPDFQTRLCYACGAHGMMHAANQIYAQLGCSAQLKQEYFLPPRTEQSHEQTVHFIRAQQSFQTKGSLLESAEAAGLRPAHGCRMGICNSCSCTKLSGTTKNILTGEINQQSNSQIKLCISQALSPVEINL